jgi:hypothetical protein
MNVEAPNGNLKYAAYLTLALMVILSIGSVVFYKERLLFSDATHNLFRIINYNTVQVEAERYGIAITQYFPLWGARLHLSLGTLMMLYSTAFYVFYLGTILLLIFYFKEYELAVLYGMYMTLFVSLAYYYLNNEGVALLFLAMATNNRLARKNTPLYIAVPVFIITVFLALWTHPLVMFPAVFLWFFLWLDRAVWPYTQRQTIIYTGILLLLAFLKFWQGKDHGYDGGRIEVVTAFHMDKLKDITSAPQFRFFVKNCIYDYWLFVIVLLVGFYTLLRRRAFLQTALVASVTGVYILLLIVTFWGVDFNKFHLEIEYMPLGVIAAAAFVYYTLRTLSRNVAIVAIVVIYVVRLGYMAEAGTAYKHRIAMLENINITMKSKGLTKVILTPPWETADKELLMKWGAPAESMVLSQLAGEVPQRTFIFMNEDELKRFNTQSNDTLLGCFQKFAAGKLNGRYFTLDTTTGYKKMSFDELMTR